MTLLLAVLLASAAFGQEAPASSTWTFAVSGDSRNCGDVVMPAIAKSALASNAAFYWHLGDLRAGYKIDEDIKRRKDPKTAKISKADYEKIEWDDFVENQIAPFGATPFFVGIGNHEIIGPKTREQFVAAFAQWLDAPILKEQRLKDDPKNKQPASYYHWRKGPVEFIYLDNATTEQFDDVQLTWFERTLSAAEADPAVKSVVVGMHESLPGGWSSSHSMEQSDRGWKSGAQVYQDLLRARDTAKKNVYILASHSHFYMKGVFNTDYWKEHGGVLPGWIIGTAGAVRYRLPKWSDKAVEGKTDVYGYLLGAVGPAGEVDFKFRQLAESDVPAETAAKFEQGFPAWCFARNSEFK